MTPFSQHERESIRLDVTRFSIYLGEILCLSCTKPLFKNQMPSIYFL